MKYLVEPPPIYFVHVPKTGGISLGSFLESIFVHWDRLRIIPPILAKLPLEKLGNFRCYHACHQGRNMLKLTGRSDLTCMTMVRDPIERSVSQILYLQRMVREMPHTYTREYLEEVGPVVNCSLSEYLNHQAFVNACDSQIRTLGIMEDYTPLFKGGPDVASGRSVIRPYPLPQLMDSQNKTLLLENALRWMEEMEVIGLTERYDESIQLMCDVIGVPPPVRMPRMNTNPDRSGHRSDYARQLPKRLQDQLRELTSHDHQLYDRARDLFNQQWSRFCSRPRRIYSIGPRIRMRILHPVMDGLKHIKRGIQKRTSMACA